MKAKEIGNLEVSVFMNFYSTESHVITLKQALFDVPKRFINSITQLRNIKDHELQKSEKKKFPVFTASAVCGFDPVTGLSSRRREFALKTNPILIIDIDKQDNPKIDMDLLKRELIKVDSVYCVSKSIRGEGLFVVMLVEHPDKLKEHYESICFDFANIGVKVDIVCKDLTRARFISYDPDILIKSDEEDILPYNKLQEPSDYINDLLKQREENKTVYPVNKNRLTAILDLLFDECLYSGTGEYNNWISEGFRLYSMSNSLGYDYCLNKFITYSSNTPGYDGIEKVTKKFNTFSTTAEKNPDLNKLTGFYYKILRSKLGDKIEDKIKEKMK